MNTDRNYWADRATEENLNYEPIWDITKADLANFFLKSFSVSHPQFELQEQ